MLQKKKGFTLVEVLVVILISGLVLSMVATAMIFVITSSGDLIQQAEDIDMAKNIEKYLRNTYREKTDCDFQIEYSENDSANNGVFSIDTEGNMYEVVDDGTKIIFSDTGLTVFTISSEENGFIKCYMRFDSGKEFSFTLGIVQ